MILSFLFPNLMTSRAADLILLVIVGIPLVFTFYGLLFIPYILVLKRERYIIREIVQENRAILTAGGHFYKFLLAASLIAGALYNALIRAVPVMLAGLFFSLLTWGIHVFLSLLYLVSFGDYKSTARESSGSPETPPDPISLP